jgi:hypothetical protein
MLSASFFADSPYLGHSPLFGCYASILPRVFCLGLLCRFDFVLHVIERLSQHAFIRQQLFLGQPDQAFVADPWRGRSFAALAATRLPGCGLVRRIVGLQQLDHQSVGILQLVAHHLALVVDRFQYAFKRPPPGFVFQNLGGFPLRPRAGNLIRGVVFQPSVMNAPAEMRRHRNG